MAHAPLNPNSDTRPVLTFPFPYSLSKNACAASQPFPNPSSNRQCSYFPGYWLQYRACSREALSPVSALSLSFLSASVTNPFLLCSPTHEGNTPPSTASRKHHPVSFPHPPPYFFLYVHQYHPAHHLSYNANCARTYSATSPSSPLRDTGLSALLHSPTITPPPARSIFEETRENVRGVGAPGSRSAPVCAEAGVEMSSDVKHRYRWWSRINVPADPWVELFATNSAYISGRQHSPRTSGMSRSILRRFWIAALYHFWRASSDGGCGSLRSSIPMMLVRRGVCFFREWSRTSKTWIAWSRLKREEKKLGGREVPECESWFCFPGAAWRSVVCKCAHETLRKYKSIVAYR